jgi:methionine sulfoxide reductase heme-binding subunit
MRAWLLRPSAKRVLLGLCFVPFLLLTYKTLNDTLGPNPAEALIRSTGDWSIRVLCVVLCVTPLRILTSTPALIRFRRMIGLSVFAYASLHLLCYAGFDMGFDWDEILKDIIKRPFILVGFLGWVSLLCLALTSSNAAIKKMGAKRWQTLHKLVYLIAVLAVVHFYWMKAAKHNFQEVIIYAIILGVLLLWRVWHAAQKRHAA